jgi:putative FmdB family regulatory protein
MPIYEYTCKSCNKKFDHLARSMNDSGAKVKCPECGSDKTAKALSVFAAVGGDTAKSSAPAGPPSCGHCGGAPGSCGR